MGVVAKRRQWQRAALGKCHDTHAKRAMTTVKGCFIMRNHHDDSSWGVMTHPDDSSWMNQHCESWWSIMMIHRDEWSWFIMMNHDDSSLRSTVRPWRDSFRGVMALFAIGAMTFFQGVFLPWSPLACTWGPPTENAERIHQHARLAQWTLFYGNNFPTTTNFPR